MQAPTYVSEYSTGLGLICLWNTGLYMLPLWCIVLLKNGSRDKGGSRRRGLGSLGDDQPRFRHTLYFLGEAILAEVPNDGYSMELMRSTKRPIRVDQKPGWALSW